MREVVWCWLATDVLLCSFVCAAEGSGDERLEGMAEDLWGDKVDLSAHDKGVVLIHPFSPANCGYCLIDGEFVKKNYFENNAETGGVNFLQCLFNPQLDIYSYQKHYREASVRVLTFPPELHRYHRDGFPFLIAFRDGKLIHQRVIHPYEETFRSLVSELWPGRDVSLEPTSPAFVATRFWGENKSHLGVLVLPDGDEGRYEKASRRWEKSDGVRVKYESELEGEDLEKNLYFDGQTDAFKWEVFEGQNTPLRVSPSSMKLGEYEFPAEEVGVFACFPNPHSAERYVVLELWGGKLGGPLYEGHVDFVISRRGEGGRLEALIHGGFKKGPGGRWEYSDSLAFKAEGVEKYARKGVSKELLKGREARVARKRDIRISPWVEGASGKARSLGSSACRFPSMAVDSEGICWVTWEEDGDILLASVNGPEPQKALAVEGDASDSFNPVLAFDGSALWVFYLNDRGGFYRLYGRYFDGKALSDAMPVSEESPFDVITPGVASNGRGKMVVAWSEWKANLRYLRHRVIADRTLGEMRRVAVKRAGGYVNAWYPSLCMSEGGDAWGAWNQHYPATLGVCAGNLAEEATSVTELTGDIGTNENGGYPSIVVGKEGKRWVFWESFGWDVRVEGQAQKILGACYDEEGKAWAERSILSREEQTILNQTPRAVVDRDGTIWLVWSGRKKDIAEPWGVYLSRRSEGKWSVPVRISSEGENARAPAICIGKDGEIWVSWHSGRGDGMRVKVLQYRMEGSEEAGRPGVKAGSS